MYEVVQYIPEFISEVKIQEGEGRMWGRFHLGNTYDFREWERTQESKIFGCKEQDTRNMTQFQQRRLVITPTCLLVLEPFPNNVNLGTLTSWATLQSLDRLKRAVSRPDIVSFCWRHMEGKQPWVLTLQIQNHQACISHIVDKMNELGVGVEKNVKKQAVIKENEVNKDAMSHTDINTILDNIAAYEEAIENELSLSTI